MFKQEVLIKNVPFIKVIESFHNKDFVRYLIKFQPVEMISWTGIKSGKKAKFRFWFLGGFGVWWWKDGFLWIYG